MNVYVARQPIFDSTHEVIAYELLYRSNEKNFYDASLRDSVATSILLLNSYLSFGLNHLTQEKKAFVNFGPLLILDDVPRLLNKDKVVIELLESVVPTKELLTKIKEYKRDGYIIALDDYISGYPHKEILELADIVKVDFRANTDMDIRRICVELKDMNKILLAEKVETKEEFEWAKRIGFEFFQGYFFAKPTIVKKKRLSGAAYHYVEIMKELDEPEPKYKKITEIIESEVSLTYKLLKLVNSSFSLVDNVSSIKHCLSILGIEAFSQWFTLATIHQLTNDKPSEILRLAMQRMKFLENIAMKSAFSQHIHELRLTGLLSVIDALLEVSMEDALAELPVTKHIKDTLLLRETIYSNVFRLALAYEQGDFDQAEKYAKSINLDFAFFPDLYIGAVDWANQLYEFLNSDL